MPRLKKIHAQLLESAPAFMHQPLVDLVADRASFSILLLEELQERWFNGEIVNVKEYDAINSCAVQMLADTAKRTTYEVKQ